MNKTSARNWLHARVIYLVASLLLILGMIGPRLAAQSGNATGSGLSISPTSTPLRINPGETDRIRLNLRNVTNGDITAKAYVNDFESDNETGEPKINLDDTTENEASIARFLDGVTDVDLKRGEEKTFEISVTIPQDAAPGAYYGLIRYAAVPAGEAAPEPGQVSLTASVASLVLIEVAGDIKELVELRNVQIYRNGRAGNFFVSRPDQVGVEVANLGNGFAQPFGTVTIKNPLGKQSYQYEINDSDPRGNVLPDSSRIFKNELKGVNWPGIYRVTASVSFGDTGGEILIQQQSFWYVPAWFIVMLVVLLILIVAVVYRIRRRVAAMRRRH